MVERGFVMLEITSTQEYSGLFPLIPAEDRLWDC